MDCTIYKAAFGVIEIANAAMARALRHISTERGQDPAEYTLLSFGGAGGLHACALAEAINIKRILIPRYPGAFSAIGLAMANIKREYVRALPAQSSLSEAAVLSAVAEMFLDMEQSAESEMIMDGHASADLSIERSLDMRYAGQAFDLRIAYEPGATSHSHVKAAHLARNYHNAHQLRYGHSDPGHDIEVVAARLTASAKSRIPEIKVVISNIQAEPIEYAHVYTSRGLRDAPVYHREDIAADQAIRGPALVIQPDATTYIEVGWNSVTDVSGNLIIEQGA
jgi:N-methylhydantoinase A